MENEIVSVENEERLGEIAVEIRIIQENTRKVVLGAAMETGKLLAEAKEKAGHGNWEKWLAENTNISQSSAGNCIKLFEELGSQQNLWQISDEVLNKLSYTQGLALIGIKDPVERADFVEQNDIAEMSTRELQQKVKELNDAKKEVEDAKHAAAEAERAKEATEKQMAAIEYNWQKVKDEQIVNERRIKELENALNDAKAVNSQTLETTVVYQDTEETIKELTALKQKHEALEVELKQKREEYEAQLKAFQSAKAPATDPNIIMLKAKLETLRSIYKEAVELIEKLSEDNRAKPRQAIINFADWMKKEQVEAMADGAI